MRKLNNFWIYPLLLIGILVLPISRCKKDDNSPGNPYNGKTTAVFNPSLTYGSMTDQDGNIYKTIQIGNQVWMAENLRTTKYNDGTAIPKISDFTEWLALPKGAYCTYNNTINIDSIATNGFLYNWEAVHTGKLAPIGWHVASDADFETLYDYLGGWLVAGGKLKEAGTIHWTDHNTGGDNSSGFTGIPAGARYWSVSFGGIGHEASWWCSTEGGGNVMVHYLTRGSIRTSQDAANLQNGVRGHSIRCIRDN